MGDEQGQLRGGEPRIADLADRGWRVLAVPRLRTFKAPHPCPLPRERELLRTLWSERLSQFQSPLVRGNFEAHGLLTVGAE